MYKRQAPTRAKPAITRVDGIAELTFTDMGAAYTLDVECEQPMTNPTCTQDDTLMQVFAALRWVETPASKAR